MPKVKPEYIALVLVLLLFATCRRKPDERSAGRIRYQISYNEQKVGGYSATILPKEMILTFSGHMVKNTIDGGLGFFSLVHVTDLKYGQHTTWLKFIDKKYIYEGQRGKEPCCFGMLEGMKLNYTDETKVIAGLECKKAVASFPDNALAPFDIWYTSDLNVNNPNSNTPFEDIPGVLLEFNTLMGNANMHMKATGFETATFNEKHFDPPRNYRPVSRDEMETILNALMD